MKLNTLLEEIFRDELTRHGFSRVPGQWLSYVRRSPDRRQHVDFQFHKQSSSFSVGLQDIGETGRRAILLGEFEGLKDYAFKPSAPRSMQLATEQAYEHFNATPNRLTLKPTLDRLAAGYREAGGTNVWERVSGEITESERADLAYLMERAAREV